MCVTPEGRGTEGQGSDVSIDWVLAITAPADGQRRANTVSDTSLGRGHSHGQTEHVERKILTFSQMFALYSVRPQLRCSYCTTFKVINATLLTFHAHFHLAREDS